MYPGNLPALQSQIRRLEREAAILSRQIDSASGVLDSAHIEQLAFESHFPLSILYHITPANYYAQLPAEKSYVPQGYASDGFIHCTRGADLLVLVANRHFRNVPGNFLMLVIDVGLLTAPVKYEALDTALPHPFPHIYGPLNREAIVEVVKMPRGADGLFLAPPFTSE